MPMVLNSNYFAPTDNGTSYILNIPAANNKASVTSAVLVAATTPTYGIQVSSACASAGLYLSGASPVGLKFTNCTKAINFDDMVPPADAGNYGQTLDCTWLAVDPGSGGSFGAKLMFSNTDTSGYTLYGLGLRCRAHAASAVAVGLNIGVSATAASASQIKGMDSFISNSGSYTLVGSASVPSCAGHFKSTMAAAAGAVHVLWIDDESTTKPTVFNMVNITMNGSALVDNVFKVYGGDPGATNLFNFEACNQGAGAFLTPGSTVAGNPSVKLRCVFGSTTFYLQGYDS